MSFRLHFLLACTATVLINTVPASADDLASSFESQAAPFLEQFCLDCHNAENMESGIRVDQLDGRLEGRTPFLWTNIRRQLEQGAMPPEDSTQPSSSARAEMVSWIDSALLAAKRRPRAKNGSIRRLTVAQYQNTLRHLLGIEDDFTSLLPPDAVSRVGFLNQEDTMVLSPLLVEAYFEVAERALDACLVDANRSPEIQNFRVVLGQGVNPRPCPDPLILGANSHLLENTDFTVTQLRADKPFSFEPFWMRTRYRFHEGYQGNSTVRGWRNYDSIYHSVFACMRGTGGYPKGEAYQVVPEGLLLRPAIPSSLLFGKSSTYGPKANFKLALRELPDHGRFRVTVNAARYADGLLLDPGVAPLATPDSLQADLSNSGEANLNVLRSGIYQLDVIAKGPSKPKRLAITLGNRHFATQFRAKHAAFVQVRLPAAPLRVTATGDKEIALDKIVLSPIDEESPLARPFLEFENRKPTLGVHLGLRRDCGHTLAPVGPRRRVETDAVSEFVFEGAINNFPRPEVEDNNDNYLAGVREIALRHEYTDGRDMPRLLIHSIEFEGPLYNSWPPQSHQAIFVGSEHPSNSPEYAREIMARFASRAYRRPASSQEVDALAAVWRDAFAKTNDFSGSIREALIVALTSPQFLFLIESSASPEAEPINDFELSSKLAYFLWNGPPDGTLTALAENYQLRSQLEAQLDRMMAAPRFSAFAEQFVSQWLSLDKLDVVSTDTSKYPRLTTEAKRELRREPVELLLHLARHNLPLRHIVQSEFVMANEVVASYYGFGERSASGFDFQPLAHGDEQLGGLLSQAAILAGLSDGRESNPVKRGAWIARKILAEPPDDPPPNVPELTADDPTLTLRQRLELHRNQRGCVKCHEGIDPWGIPLEEFDAGGRYKRIAHEVDASSKLPDETVVQNTRDLKRYLATDRIDQVAFSFLKHLATYAAGRELSYSEIEFLREAGVKLAKEDYRVRDLFHFVVTSPIFLEK